LGQATVAEQPYDDVKYDLEEKEAVEREKVSFIKPVARFIINANQGIM